MFAAAEADVSTVGEVMLRGVLGDEAWEGLPDPVTQTFIENGPAIVAEHRAGVLEIDPSELGSVAHPTLIVGGEDSPPALVEMTNLLASALPAARVAWVEGGHLINPAHPVVLDFVDEVFRTAVVPGRS